MIGKKIKELRVKNNMTQKDLADMLYVSGQAVSRWENEEVEPSLGTIKEMAKIFNVSIDELLENESPPKVEQTPTTEPVKEVVVEKEYVYKEPPKQAITICEVCNKPLYSQDEVHRYHYKVHTGGRGGHYEDKSKVMCEDCYNKQIDQDNKIKAQKEAQRRAEIKKKRIIGYVASTIVLLIFLIIGISTLIKGEDTDEGIFEIVLGVCGFAFAGCMAMDNTFISDMWLSVSSWSIRLPGVIFTLDLDGLIWLLTVKLLGALLSIFVTICAILFATALGFALSIFAYPFALSRSYRYYDA